MHTQFSNYRALLFKGQPTTREISPDYPVTPPTPSTAKTNEVTNETVQGALEILNGMFNAGTLEKDVYEKLSGAYRLSQSTSDGYKDKAKRFDSKRMGANDDVDEIETELNKSKRQTEKAFARIQKTEADNSQLIQEIGRLRQQLTAASGSNPEEAAPLNKEKAKLQPQKPNLAKSRLGVGPSSQFSKQPFQRTKSRLSASITANPDPTADKAEPDKTPHAGNIKSSDRQL